VLKVVLITILLLSGCATMTKDEQEKKRAELDLMANDTIAALIKQQPELQQQLDSAVGYAVGDIKFVKIPILGTGSGEGVLFDRERNETRYLKIKRLDLGAGLGARSVKALLVLPEREQFNEFKEGQYLYNTGAEASLGTSAKDSATAISGYQLRLLAEGGASATVTMHMVSVSIDTALTPMAESETSYPTLHGNLEADGITSDEPRVWEHKLPFFAQDVIDMGFDLPLPYGVGITYANVRQDLILTDLEVGVNGGGTVPINFVSFDNARAINNTFQLKADAWLFPFMNVYAVLGYIDGVAPLEFTINGDDALAQAGIDCTPPPPPPPIRPPVPPACNFLQGKQLTVPVEAEYYGTNVGVGTVLAAGWGDYFVVLPITYVVSDINIIDSRVETLNVTPRIGKTFNLQEYGRLSAFVGATYLDVDMDLTGSVPIPGSDGTIDYKIHQSNKDKWNALIGGNWDINKYWAWSVEVGFAGSRENIITALTRRY